MLYKYIFLVFITFLTWCLTQQNIFFFFLSFIIMILKRKKEKEKQYNISAFYLSQIWLSLHFMPYSYRMLLICLLIFNFAPKCSESIQIIYIGFSIVNKIWQLIVLICRYNKYTKKEMNQVIHSKRFCFLRNIHKNKRIFT